MSKTYHLAIVGATGAVGTELIRLLERRDFPVGSLKLFASTRSNGKTLNFRGTEIPVETLTEQGFSGIDFALFSAGTSTARTFAPAAAKAGAVVIDNSSAFQTRSRRRAGRCGRRQERVKGHEPGRTIAQRFGPYKIDPPEGPTV